MGTDQDVAALELQTMKWLAAFVVWLAALTFIVAWIRAATENERRLEELRREEVRRRVRSGGMW